MCARRSLKGALAHTHRCRVLAPAAELLLHCDRDHHHLLSATVSLSLSISRQPPSASKPILSQNQPIGSPICEPLNCKRKSCAEGASLVAQHNNYSRHASSRLMHRPQMEPKLEAPRESHSTLKLTGLFLVSTTQIRSGSIRSELADQMWSWPAARKWTRRSAS